MPHLPFPRRTVAVAAAALAVALLLAASVPSASYPDRAAEPEPVMPAYDEEGRLLLPADYRRWVFAGSSLGLSYSEGELSHEMFHHTLIEPTAYAHFAATGEFRDGTMLVLMLHGTGDGVLPGRQGRFAAEIHGVEMAVKDHGRFDEGWAYYGFGGMSGIRDRSEAFAKENCYECHLEHAARDNVFLQFYPLLAEAAPEATAAAAPRPGVIVVGEGEGEGGAVASSDPLPPLALEGLDPVLLADGREEMGKPEIVMVHDGRRYQFLVEPTRARFEAEPARYAVP